MAEANNLDDPPWPTVVVCSRTHSQLSQLVSEWRKARSHFPRNLNWISPPGALYTPATISKCPDRPAGCQATRDRYLTILSRCGHALRIAPISVTAVENDFDSAKITTDQLRSRQMHAAQVPAELTADVVATTVGGRAQLCIHPEVRTSGTRSSGTYELQ